MRFNIITLFPEFFVSPLKTSIIGKALEKDIIKLRIYNIRDYTKYKHKQCDDKPYGGGAGMVMMIEPIYNALAKIKKEDRDTKVIFLSPQGKIYNQKKAFELAKNKSLTLICGHYEGVDNRIYNFIDEEISIGDYILTGGEVAALVLIDSISRLLEGVVKNKESIKEETFSNNLLKYPQYTKPRNFLGYKVPEVLLSGNHQEVYKWRKEEQIKITKKKRPDIYKKFLKSEVKK